MEAGGTLEIGITGAYVMIFPGIMGIGDGCGGLFSEMIGWKLDNASCLIRLMRDAILGILVQMS